MQIKKNEERTNIIGEYARLMAYTIAEILIVLGTIGIIAEMTLPTVIQKQKEQTTVAQVKKTYATLANAFQSAIYENGPIETWDAGSGKSYEKGDKILNYLKPYLSVRKYCGVNEGKCFAPKADYILLHTTGKIMIDVPQYSGKAGVQLTDGTSIAFGAEYYPTCSTNNGSNTKLRDLCGTIIADVNGQKGPNVVGIDTFWFVYGKNGIVPRGLTGAYGSDQFENGCSPATSNGQSCTAWVMYVGNLDYLKCPGSVSWNGAHKCP